MKTKVLISLMVVALLSLITKSLYAANGDLIVNGNLGVGTSTPSEKAEVNGNLKVDQNLTVQGNLVTNGSTSLGGNTSIQGNLVTSGSATISGQLSVGSQGIKFSDNTQQATTSNITTQANVTTSRTLGSVYRNTTGKTMYVRVSAFGNSSTTNMIAYTDSSSAPTTVVADVTVFIGAVANIKGQIAFEVLPGNYYKVTGAVTGVIWIESY